MREKVLFCATVDSHILNFHVPYLEYFKSQGYEVHVATGGNQEIPFCDKKHIISIAKKPVRWSNLKAYDQLKKIIEQEKFEIIHCHTPMGGVITRLAARRARRKGTKVLYTAHGFHFYKGAPIINWMLYYPIEKYLSRYTDCLITINKEDYNRAVNKKFKAKKIEYIRGVGISLERFNHVSLEAKNKLKKEYGYSEKDYILVYVAELSKRKNQEMIIRAMTNIKKNIPEVKLLLVGTGDRQERYKILMTENKLSQNIFFLGHRKDVENILGLCDVYVSTSKQEGLPVNIMEAMAMGLPICATKNRGHAELIEHNINGYLVNTKNREELINAIIGIYQKKINESYWKEENEKRIKELSITEVKTQMQEIYIRSQEEEISEPAFYSI